MKESTIYPSGMSMSVYIEDAELDELAYRLHEIKGYIAPTEGAPKVWQTKAYTASLIFRKGKYDTPFELTLANVEALVDLMEFLIELKTDWEALNEALGKEPPK